MRVIGLDFGDKTIGVSISDPFLIIASGHTVILRTNKNEYKKSLKELSEIIDEYEVSKIVLGYPKNMNNSEGARCQKTNEFKEKLNKRFPLIEVLLWDERLSTIGASRSLLEADVSRGNRKKVIDKMAAVFILQGYLDSLKKNVSQQNDDV